MSRTKEKILKQSLILFNDQGLDHVSLRSISNALNMSVGNLQYHFKKREDIIHELYFQLVSTIDIAIENSGNTQSKLEEFFETTAAIVNCFYEYRFIFQDFTSVMNQHEAIRTHYQELMKNRKLQFSAFIGSLIKRNLMRKELLPNEYDHLFVRFQILSDFWMSSSLIELERVAQKEVSMYTEMIHQTIFPYLTETGKEAYLMIQKSI